MVPPVFKTGERCTVALAGSIPVRLRGVWYSAASLTVDPPAVRAGLARVTAPVMMYVGQAEIGPTPELAAEAVALFPGWELTVQPGAGHYPWLDDPAWFTSRLLAFLD